MDGPLILAGAAQTIQRQIETFADAHAGMPQQQQRVAGPVVATQQFPVDQLIVLGHQGAGQIVVGTRNIVGADQAGQERYTLSPRQFIQNTAQTNDVVRVGQLRQRGLARAQQRKPIEDVWVTTELPKVTHTGIGGVEIVEKVTPGALIVVSRSLGKRGGDGFSGPSKKGRPRIPRKRKLLSRHDWRAGTGRSRLAAARAYCSMTSRGEI